MKGAGILLLIAAIVFFIFSRIAFGDIGISFLAVSIVALLSGVGLISGSNKK